MAIAARALEDVTEELSGAIESGDVDTVARLLLRVDDLNARNRHGTTLLMKAACYGDAQIVRQLLVHGADPNLTRNDNFTALALAAFFGHEETVKTLMEFGARTEVVTRSGASAHTWATARTFADVARCLDTPSPKTTAPVAPIQRRDSSPRPRILALGMVATFMVIVCCGFGVLIMRSLEARDLPPVALQPEPPTPKPIVVETSDEPTTENLVLPTIKKVFVPTRKAKSVAVAIESEKPVAAPAEKVQVSVAPPVSKPKFDPPKTTALSPQIIAPSKKARVIQWP